MKIKCIILFLLLVLIFGLTFTGCSREIIRSEIEELPIPTGSVKVRDIVTALDGSENMDYESTLSLERLEYLYDKYMPEWNWKEQDLDTSVLGLNLTFYDGVNNNTGSMALVGFEEKNGRVIITLGIGPK